MRVHVTQDDINRGRRGFTDQCPIAQAIKREHGWSKVFVYSNGLTVNGVWYNLPSAARAFINQFDRWFPVEPLEFVCELQ